MTNEDQRYAAVSEQIKQLLDAAANDEMGIASLGRIWLAAELYERNEKAHASYYQDQATSAMHEFETSMHKLEAQAGQSSENLAELSEAILKLAENETQHDERQQQS